MGHHYFYEILGSLCITKCIAKICNLYQLIYFEKNKNIFGYLTFVYFLKIEDIDVL